MDRFRVTFAGLLILLVAVLALKGCGGMPDMKQESPQVNLGVGYILLAQVRLMGADALKAKVISVDDAKNILALTDTCRQTLDVARDAYFGGSNDAPNKALEITEIILNQIKNDLEAKVNAKAGKK